MKLRIPTPKKMTRTLLVIAVFTLLAVSWLPQSVAAQTNVLDPVCADYAHLENDDPNKPTVCKDNTEPSTPEDNRIYGPNGIISKVVNILSIVVGIAAVIMIIVGGFKYVLSTGDSAGVNSAKNTILYAVIGLVIAVLGQAIIIFVINKL